MKKVSALFAAIASLVLAVTPWAAHAEEATVNIGVPSATKTLLGSQLVKGAQYAADKINSEGGVLGKKINLIIYDTALSPAEGANIAQRLAVQDKVKFVAGEVSSTVAFAMMPTFRKAGILFMAGVPKHPDVTATGYDRLFRLNSTTQMDVNAFKPELVRRFGDRKIALLNENSDFGLDGRKNLEAVFAKPGQVVFNETYDVTQSDFNGLVANMRRSNAGALCITGTNPEQYGNIVRMAAEVNFKPAICLMPGILYPGALKIIGPASEGAISADIYVPSLDNPLNKTFVEGYRKKHNADPDKSVAIGYEGVALLAQAMVAAKTVDDAGKVAQTLHGRSWQTPRGTLSFGKDGQATGAYSILTVKNGKIEILK
jgi:branched-chain amino acid transport system substrate-binding protein